MTLVAVVLNVPKAFELETENVEYFDEELNETAEFVGVKSAEIRFNETYVLWYHNVARLLMTGKQD